MTTPDPTVPRWTPETEKLLRRAIADPGQFCARDRWRDTSGIGGWEYESIPAWGARAATIALSAAAALVTPEMTALRFAAHEWRTTGAAGGFDHLAASLHLLAAVDALEARPHPDTTGAAR